MSGKNDGRPVQYRNPYDPDVYFANCAKLPPLAYAQHPSDACMVVVVQRGHGGCWPVGRARFPDETLALDFIREQNARVEVTSAQAHALLHGSVFGFDTPSADPDNDINHSEKAPLYSAYVKPAPNEGPVGTTVIDFGVLLKKYMRHVQMCEGVAFIGNESSGDLNSDVTFTPAEMAALEGILNEINQGA